MADTISLAAEARERAGKGAARQTRRDGRVPAVIYGNKQAPVMISLESKGLLKQIRGHGFFSHVFEIDIDGTKERVLARDLQKDPVTEAPLHVDFMRFSATTTFEVDVEVVFENEDDSPGLKFGGVLNVVMRTIPLICRPDAIPERISVDLTGLEVGDVIHLSTVSIPASAELAITDPEATVATIAAPTIAPVEEEEAEEGEEVEAEGEEDADEDEKKEGDED
jgi:large subunit ribosomal protein L25